jgi:hypothetical protein
MYKNTEIKLYGRMHHHGVVWCRYGNGDSTHADDTQR